MWRRRGASVVTAELPVIYGPFRGASLKRGAAAAAVDACASGRTFTTCHFTYWCSSAQNRPSNRPSRQRRRRRLRTLPYPRISTTRHSPPIPPLNAGPVCELQPGLTGQLRRTKVKHMEITFHKREEGIVLVVPDDEILSQEYQKI